jgi:hypothetical protein
VKRTEVREFREITEVKGKRQALEPSCAAIDERLS